MELKVMCDLDNAGFSCISYKMDAKISGRSLKPGKELSEKRK